MAHPLFLSHHHHHHQHLVPQNFPSPCPKHLLGTTLWPQPITSEAPTNCRVEKDQKKASKIPFHVISSLYWCTNTLPSLYIQYILSITYKCLYAFTCLCNQLYKCSSRNLVSPEKCAIFVVQKIYFVIAKFYLALIILLFIACRHTCMFTCLCDHT